MRNFNLTLPRQNGIWVNFYHFWPINDGKKWSRKNIFEIPPHAKQLSDSLIYFIETGFFYKITNSVRKITLFANGGISNKIFVRYVQKYSRL